MIVRRRIKVFVVAGARPNFVKVAPIMRELEKSAALKPVLVHTGQHYDAEMSRLFFDQLAIPAPDVDLGVGSASHAVQTAHIMTAFEREMLARKPGLVVVVGDVNSTLACTLVAAKLLVPVAHVEAGLRSFDRTMPEEINRVVTDSLASFHFVTEPSGRENLIREGIRGESIHFVGNVMIDTLAQNLKRVRSEKVRHPLEGMGMDYAVVTLHRPTNVDDRETFAGIIGALEEISRNIPVFLPAHPRTEKNARRFGLMKRFSLWRGSASASHRVFMLEPLGYLPFLAMMRGARMVLTDSGGIQEETTFLGIPCITLRETTERPVTVEVGTNVVVGSERRKIVGAAMDVLDGRAKKGRVPELWDGKAARRIVEALEKAFAREGGVRRGDGGTGRRRGDAVP
ncbi:MAG: UDP-N-acetylglucosamine 2-epimerase (non-hydrolyzing) [bacterium]